MQAFSSALLASSAFQLRFLELTDLDLWLQDHFYNFSMHRWLVDENEPVGRVIFYNGPKVLI